MNMNQQRLKDAGDIAELRKEAGLWLRDKRETAGLSQRELATKVGFDYYTFISQIEAGRGKVPSERYEAYSVALNLDPREFAITMLRYNDPHTYALIFGEREQSANPDVAALEERLRRLEAMLGA
ncbi:helix-turn-helix domain-containing protein [Rhizobium oryzicola]|uniref:Helix-turn-helix transcriptional regulator n=1 Tax=Rhizobium oryzicola TaxID=1232668 RepID=A0ABT8T7T3_9HYPH|nr:helix-turn-helix transcriptional regulator [Rhizobium oryzicola]MDO1585591.1 helix-turn-helix transcriptional regulator [Rhizobium oryzicola]